MGNNLSNGDKRGFMLAALRSFLADAERLGYAPDSIVHVEATGFGRKLKSISVREGDTRSAAEEKMAAKAAKGDRDVDAST